MSDHLIVTTISGKPLAIAPDTINKCMTLVPADVPSGLSHAYVGDNTACKQLLQWINKNDSKLAEHQWSILPKAKFLK
jgi:hypothetical protein